MPCNWVVRLPNIESESLTIASIPEKPPHIRRIVSLSLARDLTFGLTITGGRNLLHFSELSPVELQVNPLLDLDLFFEFSRTVIVALRLTKRPFRGL